jgi:hypothetical protein
MTPGGSNVRYKYSPLSIDGGHQSADVSLQVQISLIFYVKQSTSCNVGDWWKVAGLIVRTSHWHQKSVNSWTLRSQSYLLEMATLISQCK